MSCMLPFISSATSFSSLTAACGYSSADVIYPDCNLFMAFRQHNPIEPNPVVLLRLIRLMQHQIFHMHLFLFRISSARGKKENGRILPSFRRNPSVTYLDSLLWRTVSNYYLTVSVCSCLTAGSHSPPNLPLLTVSSIILPSVPHNPVFQAARTCSSYSFPHQAG